MATSTVSPEAPKTVLRTSMIPGCCGLKTIHKLDCLGKTDALSKKYSEPFDELTKVGTAQDGNWNTYGKSPDTIAIITTSNRYHYNDLENIEFKRQVEFLTSKGWHEICSWKSKESGGMNYMWGSPGIKNSKE